MKRICLLLTVLVTMCIQSAAFAAGRIPPGMNDLVKNKNEAIIIVGDSRVMRMAYFRRAYETYTKNYCFVHHNGGGIGELRAGGVTERNLRTALSRYPSAPVVFWFGVNGGVNQKLLKRNYDYYIKTYPSHTYYIGTIGPIGYGKGDLKKGYRKSNTAVIGWNKEIRKRYGKNREAVAESTGNDNFQLLELYKYMEENAVVTPGGTGKNRTYYKDAYGYASKTDGIHYNNRTRKVLLRYIRKIVGK